MSGSHLKLEGTGAFDAAVHCASVAAAERQQRIKKSYSTSNLASRSRPMAAAEPPLAPRPAADGSHVPSTPAGGAPAARRRLADDPEFRNRSRTFAVPSSRGPAAEGSAAEEAPRQRPRPTASSSLRNLITALRPQRTERDNSAPAAELPGRTISNDTGADQAPAPAQPAEPSSPRSRLGQSAPQLQRVTDEEDLSVPSRRTLSEVHHHTRDRLAMQLDGGSRWEALLVATLVR